MIELNEGTAARRRVPMRLFASDGTSPDTGALNDAVIMGVNSLGTISLDSTCREVHAAQGMYAVELTQSETSVAGIHPLYHTVGAFPQHVANAVVVNSNPYSSQSNIPLVATVTDVSNQVTADMTAISGDATAANNLELAFDGTGYDSALTVFVKDSIATIAGVTNIATDVAAVPTAVENRTEMDTNSTELAKVGTIPALDGGGQTIGAAIAKLADDNAGADFDAGTDSLQAIRDKMNVYQNNSIWIDTLNGAAGTTNFVNGTVDNPVNSIADANTLATSLNIKRFEVAPGSSITFAATQTGQVFTGERWTLALGGEDVVNSTFIGAVVSGVMAGTGVMQSFINCLMNATSIIKGTIYKGCTLAATQTVVEAGEFLFSHCYSSIAGAGTVTFDFGSLLNSSNLSVRQHAGGWTIENMGAGTGTYNATFEGHGQIVWAASCSATSNASIRGHWRITDNASGAVTETKDDITVDVDAVLVDTNELQVDWTNGGRLDNILDGRLAPTTAGRTLDVTAGGTAGIDWANVEAPTTAVDLSATTVNQAATIGAGGIASTVFAAGAIDAASLATDASAEIADALLDRNMATGADSGSSAVRTPRDAFRSLRNRVDLSENTLTVFEEDDVTEAWRASLTTSGDSNFPTAMDPSG